MPSPTDPTDDPTHDRVHHPNAGADRPGDAPRSGRDELRAQTAAIQRMSEAVLDATESVNAREFARIADRSEARLNGFAGAGLLTLVLALLAATHVTIPVWHGRVPGWMAAPAAWTAAAYGAAAVLIALTRLADTRYLLVMRLHAAVERRRARQPAGPAASDRPQWAPAANAGSER